MTATSLSNSAELVQTFEPVVELNEFKVYELQLSWPKIAWLWQKMQEYKTLFSDLTRQDFGNFLNTLVAKSAYWFEIHKDDQIVGLVWFTDTYQVVDMTVHCVMFDRRPAEKAPLLRELTKWMFANFPINRVTAVPPAIYFGTVNLLRKLGFSHEGTKRGAVLIGGKWIDILIYGITRNEVTQWD